MNHRENAPASAHADASIIRAPFTHLEDGHAHGVYHCRLLGPKEEHRAAYLTLDPASRAAVVAMFEDLERRRDNALTIAERGEWATLLERHSIEVKWQDDAVNVVTTQGGNYLLDAGIRAQTVITSWFIGLITSTGYTTGPVAADTAAQINGTNAWKEAGATNAPNYTGARQALTVANATTGKTLTASAVSSFPMLAAGTIKGCFLVSASAKDATTGTLYSAGLFTGGDKTVGNGDTLQVTYAASV